MRKQIKSAVSSALCICYGGEGNLRGERPVARINLFSRKCTSHERPRMNDIYLAECVLISSCMHFSWAIT